MKVAEEMLAYCSSCKMDLAHTVSAMKGDRAVRVVCNTCKKDHAYKAPKGMDGLIRMQTVRYTLLLGR